jgi:hypothetical protein
MDSIEKIAQDLELLKRRVRAIQGSSGTGLLPAGAAYQRLQHDGGYWRASSTILFTNDGFSVNPGQIYVDNAGASNTPLRISGRVGAAGNHAGGKVVVTGGAGLTDGAGGDVEIIAGSGAGAAADGIVDLQGATRIQAGATLYSGGAAPPSGFGVAGDLYLSTAGHAYIATGADTWKEITHA